MAVLADIALINYPLHYPLSIHIAGQTLLLHSVFETLGMFIAFRYYLYLKRREGDFLSTDRRLAILVMTIFGALAGSHIVGAMENIPQWRGSSHFWQYLWGNKTILGGMFGGLMAVEAFKTIIGEKSNTGDLFTFPLLLGVMIGRIGCFTAGIHEETYGLPSGLPWAMDLGDGIGRHPVALYEIAFLGVLWVYLYWLKKTHDIERGALFRMLLIGYFVFRFLLDLIKPGWRYCLGLGTIQLTCIAGLLYNIKYIVHYKKYYRKNAG